MVVIDSFSKFGWKVPLGSKNAQTMKKSFENLLITSKQKQISFEEADGKYFVNKIFSDLLNKSEIKGYNRFKSIGAAFAGRFNHIVRDLLKRPVFEKNDANWIDVLAEITNK